MAPKERLSRDCTIASPELAAGIETKLRDLGLFRLKSISQPLFDGSWAVIAARNSHHVNVFSEYSIDSEQANLRSMFLTLADEYADRAALLEAAS